MTNREDDLRNELLALVVRIQIDDFESEEAGISAVNEFQRRVPHPRASDLIFFPEEEFGREPSPEEIVDRALRYVPLEVESGATE